MILQSLNGYYSRLVESGVDIAQPGYAPQRVSFAIVLKPNGTLASVDDLRDTTGKKPKAVMMNLPSIQRSGAGFAPQFMWDNIQYVLGRVSPDETAKKQERAPKAFDAFRTFHRETLADIDHPDSNAFLSFLDQWTPEQGDSIPYWEEIVQIAGPNFVYRMEGQRKYLHEYPEIRERWTELSQRDQDAPEGVCLITGNKGALARLHPGIKGVDGGQAKGGSIVSFNLDAFTSYNKEQSYNAPTSPQAAFAYTTALNHLLRRDPANRQRIKLGDTITVFWAQQSSPMESFLGFMLDPHEGDAVETEKLHSFLDAVRKGHPPDGPDLDPSVPFYILGLAPNAARISVRFWHVCTVGDIEKNIQRHYQDLEIVRSKKDPLYPSAWLLLKQTARESKDVSPLLGGQFAKSILTGQNYPETLLASVIQRIRADQTINYYRAAIIKAVLMRNRKEFITMALNTESTEPAYLMGRLFAVLEKLQSDALPGINSTIKDRYFSSASATPTVVFPRLLRLSAHHLNKLDKPAWKIGTEKLIGEIIGALPGEQFPAHLNLENQGKFIIGYYHQNRDLWAAKADKAAAQDDKQDS